MRVRCGSVCRHLSACLVSGYVVPYECAGGVGRAAACECACGVRVYGTVLVRVWHGGAGGGAGGDGGFVQWLHCWLSGVKVAGSFPHSSILSG